MVIDFVCGDVGSSVVSKGKLLSRIIFLNQAVMKKYRLAVKEANQLMRFYIGMLERS